MSEEYGDSSELDEFGQDPTPGDNPEQYRLLEGSHNPDPNEYLEYLRSCRRDADERIRANQITQERYQEILADLGPKLAATEKIVRTLEEKEKKNT